MSYLSHLECPECGRVYAADEINTFCGPCASPLLARYDLDAARAKLDRDALAGRPADMWRWRELMPVRDPSFIKTAGEGGTPCLEVPRLAESLGTRRLWVKDEGRNPTGTFKARGLAAAVFRAVELGIGGFVVPTAGHAGGALAALVYQVAFTDFVIKVIPA